MKKPKLYPCKECGREVQIRSKGLCPGCRSIELGKDREPKKYYIPPINKKRNEKRKAERSCLGEFFETAIEELKKNPYSLEGGRINEPSSLNIAHCLPKRKYKSVMCNPKNWIPLTWDEHTRFDQLLDTHKFEQLEKEFPNAWKVVKERYFELFEYVTENGKLIQALKEYLNYE